LKIVTIDDSEPALNLLTESVKEAQPSAEVFAFSKPSELLDFAAQNIFDIAFIDIQMWGMNGLQLAERLKNYNPKVNIIFVTAYSEYASDAFNLYPSGYVLKPVSKESIKREIDNLRHPMSNKEDNSQMLNDELFSMFPASDRSLKKIPNESVKYLELINRRITLHLTNGEVLLSKAIRSSFKKTVAVLMEDERFISPHKSYVINMDYIEQLTGKSFIIKGGIEVFIPRYRYTEAKDKYFAWLSRKGANLADLW